MRVLLSLFFVSFLLMSCSQISVTGISKKEKYFNPIWYKNQDPAAETGNLPIALNGPGIYEGILYIGDNSGYMKAFELETGRPIWSEKEYGEYHSRMSFYKDQVIYGNAQGRVYSRHYLTGKLNYVVDLGASVESEGEIYKDRIFFQTRNHKIFCLDVTTGKILWAYMRAVPYTTTIQRVSTPTISNGNVYVGFADGSVASFRIEDGVLLWERRLGEGSKFVDVDAKPLVLSEGILVGSLSGDLFLLDSSTGQIKRKWQLKISRAPLEINGGVVLGTLDGEIVLLDEKLQIEKKIPLKNGSINSIVPWKGEYVVSTLKGKVFLIDSKTFDIKETFELGHSVSAVFGEIVSAEKKLAFLSSRNRLYVFK